MNNISKLIRQAYYDALSGNISVNVYKEDVPMSEAESYVLIRLESESDSSHKSGFVTNPIVITDVVGVFTNSIDPDTVEDIDDEVRGILLSDVNSRLLVDSIDITCIKPVGSEFISEDDGEKKYYRKVTRWQQRISHT